MIKNLLKNKILTIDGAMGTMVQSYELSEEDFRKDQFKDCLLYTSDAADE